MNLEDFRAANTATVDNPLLARFAKQPERSFQTSGSTLDIATPRQRQEAAQIRQQVTDNVITPVTQAASDPFYAFTPGMDERRQEARQRILEKVNQVVTDPMMGVIPGKGLLVPATNREGKIFTSQMGKSHYDSLVHEPRAFVPEGTTGTAGFVKDDGEFLNRKGATAWLKENAPDVYRKLDTDSLTTGLESQGYNHAAGLVTEEDALAREFLKRQFGQ